MNDLNRICSEVINSVPDGIGCAVIDLESGLLLGVAHNAAAVPESLLDTMAASIVEMFRGRNVINLEQSFAQYAGSKQTRLLEFLQMTTEKAHVFMAVLQDKPDYLVVVVSGKKANLGLGWAAIRSAMPKIKPLCP